MSKGAWKIIWWDCRHEMDGMKHEPCPFCRIQQLEEERRWIPAESLPELCRDYLCIFKDGFQTTMRWDGLHWFDVYDEGGRAYQPTHWLPLPPPPKENDND